MHFTPTYGSRMNVVERCVSALMTKVQSSAHRSVKELALTLRPGLLAGTKAPSLLSGRRALSRSSNPWQARASRSTRKSERFKSGGSLCWRGECGPGAAGQDLHYVVENPQTHKTLMSRLVWFPIPMSTRISRPPTPAGSTRCCGSFPFSNDGEGARASSSPSSTWPSGLSPSSRTATVEAPPSPGRTMADL